MSALRLVQPGEKFGRLTISKEITIRGNRRFQATCDCGNRVEVFLYSMVTGKTQSCGCLHREKVTTHGMSPRTGMAKIYNVWRTMRQRCANPRYPRYKDYGGRGITVCAVWAEDFMTFHTWAMAHGYQEGLQIDRINNNGNYEPENCRFVTALLNMRNTRINRSFTAFGETKLVAEWAEDARCRVKRSTLYNRVFTHLWDTEWALMAPAQQRRTA